MNTRLDYWAEAIFTHRRVRTGRLDSEWGRPDVSVGKFCRGLVGGAVGTVAVSAGIASGTFVGGAIAVWGNWSREHTRIRGLRKS